MADLIKVTINGKEVHVPYDTPLIEACREARADVPTLCHNENVKAYGVCRICVVEANEGRRTRLVPACVFPVRREITVATESERIHQRRAMLLNLLLARCPQEKAVQELAARYGVQSPHPRLRQANDDCILCGLCVRTCHEIVRVGAISYEGRGEHRRVVAPFDAENPVCIACGACAYICPTQCIDFSEKAGKRYLNRWHREAPMLVCEKCGNYWLPDTVATIYAKRMGIDLSAFRLCTNCR